MIVLWLNVMIRRKTKQYERVDSDGMFDLYVEGEVYKRLVGKIQDIKANDVFDGEAIIYRFKRSDGTWKISEECDRFILIEGEEIVERDEEIYQRPDLV